MIIFSEDQKEALEKMENFLNSEETILVLTGYAGCGKSFIMREFVEFLDSTNKNFVLCAPTHRAKFVLEQFTGYSAITIHKLLQLSPNVNIYHLDYKNLKFQSMGIDLNPEFPTNGIIIIDEASMVNDEMYKLLKEFAMLKNTKILFVGDPAQLDPVASDRQSQIFYNNNIIKLTKIHRQSDNNGLLPLLVKLRKKFVPKFNSIEEEEGSLFVYDDVREFLLDSVPYFRKAIDEKNINEIKLVAFTNNRVQGLNQVIRKLVLKEKSLNQYNRNEILTGYDNMSFNHDNIFNSLDYIIMNDPVLISKKLPHFTTVKGYILDLYDTIYKSTFQVFILDKNTETKILESLAFTIEDLRFSAINYKSTNYTKSKLYWKKYYELINSFASPVDLMFDNRTIKRKTLDYGYSMTLHKVQGSSLNTIFIDMKNVMECRSIDNIRQMQYVALSRTKNNAYIFQ